MVLRIVVDLIQFYLLILFVRIIFTWFPTDPWSTAGRIERALGKVTDPLLRRLRKVLPTARIGSMALDLSPIVLFVVGLILVRLL
jgi:YggT family protein